MPAAVAIPGVLNQAPPEADPLGPGTPQSTRYPRDQVPPLGDPPGPGTPWETPIRPGTPPGTRHPVGDSPWDQASPPPVDRILD